MEQRLEYRSSGRLTLTYTVFTENPIDNVTSCTANNSFVCSASTLTEPCTLAWVDLFLFRCAALVLFGVITWWVIYFLYMGNLFFSLPVHRSTVCLAVCIFVSFKVSQHTFVGKDALSLISYFDEMLGTNLIMDSILNKKRNVTCIFNVCFLWTEITLCKFYFKH